VGKPGQGPILKAGMVLAVEPIVNEGSPEVYLASDDWTYKTADKKRSAHVEHTLVVTEDGVEVLTI
jgi:methionyl aminopeptidase